jgi:hypothetical protein
MSKVIKVEKEKNMLKYYLDDKTTPYMIDLNSGKLYGLSGKQIISIPSPILHYMNYECKLESDNYSHFLKRFLRFTTSMTQLPKVWIRRAEDISAYDRLIAVGYTPDELDDRWCWDNLLNLVKHIKHFAKLKADCGGVIHIDLFEEYHELKKSLWLKENGLENNKYFNTRMCEICENLQLTTAQIKLVYSWCTEGLSTLPLGNWDMRDMLTKIFKYAKYLDFSLARGNFLKQYRDITTMYNDMKDEIENKRFLESQMKHIKALNFETADYIVVVPTKCNDLIVEGMKQCNCVGGYVNNVMDNQCNIVFIRKKSEIEKSYITCEIKNGEIKQFLLKFNGHIYEESDKEFRRLYQEHLNELWEVGE